MNVGSKDVAQNEFKNTHEYFTAEPAAGANYKTNNCSLKANSERMTQLNSTGNWF